MNCWYWRTVAVYLMEIIYFLGFFYFKLVYSGMFNPYESPSSKPAVSEDAAVEVSYKIKHKKRDDYHISNVISRLR